MRINFIVFILIRLIDTTSSREVKFVRLEWRDKRKLLRTQSLHFYVCFLYRELSWCTMPSAQSRKKLNALQTCLTQVGLPVFWYEGKCFGNSRNKNLKQNSIAQAHQPTLYIRRTAACFKLAVTRLPSAFPSYALYSKPKLW